MITTSKLGDFYYQESSLKDVIISFVTDTELYFTKMFIFNGIFSGLKYPLMKSIPIGSWPKDEH